jgi:hypothetical protein
MERNQKAVYITVSHRYNNDLQLDNWSGILTTSHQRLVVVITHIIREYRLATTTATTTGDVSFATYHTTTIIEYECETIWN